MLVRSLWRLAVLGLVLAGLFGPPAIARAASTANDPRVVAIDVDPSVVSALIVALSPWSLTVVQTPGPIPPLDVGAAATRARAVAAELHAGAVIWVAPSRKPEPRGSLWVYDAQTQQLAVRPLATATPFDAAGAAAVALSVKTILRASPLLTAERSGEARDGREGADAREAHEGRDPREAGPWASAGATGPASSGSSTSSPGPASAASPSASSTAAPPPTGATAAPASAPGATNAASPASPTSNPSVTGAASTNPLRGAADAATEGPTASAGPHAAWRLETALGARAPTGGGAEPRAVLGVSAWPAGPSGTFGLGIDVQAGPGVAIDESALQGELRRASLDVSGRLRLPLRHGLSLEGRGGAGLLLVSFDGQAQATGAPLTALRIDPTLALGALVDLALSARASLGAFVDASALLRVQHYALDGVPVLDEPVVVLFPGIRVSVEVD